MISVETFPLNSETLYIYRGVNILCLRHRHPVIEVLAVLPTMKGGCRHAGGEVLRGLPVRISE